MFDLLLIAVIFVLLLFLGGYLLGQRISISPDCFVFIASSRCIYKVINPNKLFLHHVSDDMRIIPYKNTDPHEWAIGAADLMAQGGVVCCADCVTPNLSSEFAFDMDHFIDGVDWENDDSHQASIRFFYDDYDALSKEEQCMLELWWILYAQEYDQQQCAPYLNTAK